MRTERPLFLSVYEAKQKFVADNISENAGASGCRVHLQRLPGWKRCLGAYHCGVTSTYEQTVTNVTWRVLSVR